MAAKNSAVMTLTMPSDREIDRDGEIVRLWQPNYALQPTARRPRGG
jgi:hypothetical protein